MPKAKTKDLTELAIEKMKPGATRREVPDGRVRGLFLIIQPQESGRRSWAFRYRYNGISRKLTLGPYPAISLSKARDLANRAIVAVTEGSDPATEKQAAKAAARKESELPIHDRIKDPVESNDIVTLFIKRYCEPNVRKSHLRETERILRSEVQRIWEKRRLSEITPADVLALLDGIMDRGAPIQANRTLAALRKLCNWAVERQILKVSPCDGIKAPAGERSRERILSDEELRQIWIAAATIGWPFGPLIHVLMLTGQRRSEVSHMCWAEVDFEKRKWTIPSERAKNGIAHEVPLSDAVIQIISKLPRIKGKSDSTFVFSTTGDTAVSGFGLAKRRIDEFVAQSLPKIAGWVIHDIRRTVASKMGELGIAPHVIDSILNHKSGTIRGVAAVYNRYEYAHEKRAALAMWADYVERFVSGTLAGKIVRLPRPGVDVASSR
jgi:integrase